MNQSSNFYNKPYDSHFEDGSDPYFLEHDEFCHTSCPSEHCGGCDQEWCGRNDAPFDYYDDYAQNKSKDFVDPCREMYTPHAYYKNRDQKFPKRVKQPYGNNKTFNPYLRGNPYYRPNGYGYELIIGASVLFVVSLAFFFYARWNYVGYPAVNI